MEIIRILDFSVSPKNVMMIGIAAQIIFGTLLGLIHNNEWHIILRWLTAASCALMYTSGSMICKIYFCGKNQKFYSFCCYL